MKCTGEVDTKETVWPIRKAFHNSFLVGGGFNMEFGYEAIRSGRADAVVFGRLFLANPDLVKRFALHAPLNKYKREFHVSVHATLKILSLVTLTTLPWTTRMLLLM
jgi:12-oxophytodienoic acid reductase